MTSTTFAHHTHDDKTVKRHNVVPVKQHTLPVVANSKLPLPIELDNYQVQYVQHALKTDQIGVAATREASKSCHQKSLIISSPSVAAAHNTHTLLDNPRLILPVLTEAG
jgi:hypothetical protein